MRDGGEENNISCARSDTESTCVIYWIESPRNPGEVHLNLRFGELCFGNEMCKFTTLCSLGGFYGGMGGGCGFFLRTRVCEVVFYFNSSKLPFLFLSSHFQHLLEEESQNVSEEPR